MELPKDIIQIGEANPNCKIYVEDYVISFLKQQNRQAVDKTVTVALYGRNTTDEGKTYIFVYGAGIIQSLQKEARHLSQAQNQEIEKLRKRYFAEYQLVGYRILNGEMIEGMHICEQETFRYIAGYAQFYEKNDIMLAYMLEYKGGDAQPEYVDSQKYDVVKKRQEERKNQSEGNKKKNNNRNSNMEIEMEIASEEEPFREEDGISNREMDDLKQTWSGVLKRQRQGLHRMQFATVAVFVILCLVGLYSMNGSMSVQESEAETVPVMGHAGTEEADNLSILRTDEKLTEALIEENRISQESGNSGQDEKSDKSAEEIDILHEEESKQGEEIQKPEEMTETKQTEGMPEEAGESEIQQTSASTSSQEKTYVIRKGDTLLDISFQMYGNFSMVPELCRLNHITDPDDIKVGQKILLP